jgi:hypothetical protein
LQKLQHIFECSTRVMITSTMLWASCQWIRFNNSSSGSSLNRSGSVLLHGWHMGPTSWVRHCTVLCNPTKVRHLCRKLVIWPRIHLKYTLSRFKLLLILIFLLWLIIHLIQNINLNIKIISYISTFFSNKINYNKIYVFIKIFWIRQMIKHIKKSTTTTIKTPMK